MTGLEPFIGPALGRAAAVAATRAVGWGAKRVLDRRHVASVAKHLRESLVALNADNPEVPSRLVEFSQAPEIEHFAACLVQAYLLKQSNTKTTDALHAIENEFYTALGVWLGSEPPMSLARQLFRALNEAVLSAVNQLALPRKLAPALEAELIRTAISLSAASVRNTQLLQSLGSLAETNQFQNDYAAQFRSLHSTMSLPHAGTTRRISYTKLFVAPALQLDDRGAPSEVEHEFSDRVSSAVPVEQVISSATRVVVLGNPGGGKSTLVTKISFDIARGSISSLHGRVPFLIVLRDYAAYTQGASRLSVVEYIEQICASPYAAPAPPHSVEYLLANGRAVVIFDGLDELLDTSLRRDVVKVVEGFASRFPTCPIIATSRVVGYSEAALDHDLFMPVKLADFDYERTSAYVKKWFALNASTRGDQDGGDSLASSFMRDSTFVEDLRENPLILSLMCGIYATEGYIPRNRPDVYEKCAILLFESWDKQRGIKAELPFDAHVQSAMRSLALFMLRQHPTKPALPRAVLVAHITQYLYGKRFSDEVDAENAANEFIDFCKGRAWVLTDMGSELYGFTHRTFLEYFAASQLVRENPNASKLFKVLLPRLKDESWEVVSQLALQILNKSVEDGSDDFLEQLLRTVDRSARAHGDRAKLATFAARSLNFVVPRPIILERLIEQCYELGVEADRRRRGSTPNPRPACFEELHNASPENRSRVAKKLRDIIERRLEEDPSDNYAMYVALTLAGELPRVGSAAEKDFWENWAEDNATRLRHAMDVQRNEWWVSLARHELGLAGLDEVIAEAGPRALYSFIIREVWANPPISYFAIDTQFVLRSQLFPYFKADNGPLNLLEVCDFLYKAPRPWVKFSSETPALTGPLMRSPRPARSDEHARLRDLLVLPILEELLSRRKGSAAREVVEMLGRGRVRNFAARRAGLLRMATCREADAPSPDPQHDQFLDAWMAGEIRLLGSEPGDSAARW